MTRSTSNQPPTAEARTTSDETGQQPRTAVNRGVLWTVAGVGTAVEAAALLLMGGLSGYGVVSGGASTTTRALTEAVVLVVLAIGVGILSRNLFAHKTLAKTPTLVWNFMLLPVSFSLMTGGAPLWGTITLVVAACTLLAAVLLPSYDLDEDTDDTVV